MTGASEAAGRLSLRPVWRYQWLAIAGALVFVSAAVFLAGWELVYDYGRWLRAGWVAAAAAGAYTIGLIVYRRYAWRFSVDAINIESRHGIIARQVRSIRIRDLRNINVHQSIAQRLLGVGDVEFSSAAGGEIEVMFYGVSDPLAVKRAVQARQGEAETRDG